MGQSCEIEEILVIDDGSEDKTVEIASSYPVKIIRHNKNMGLAASRNTAFREARNEFVAALDADCVANSQWLGQLMACFTDDNIIGAGGRLIERYTLTIADKWRSAHMSQQWGDTPLENPPFLYGSNTVFRKSEVKRARFYEERFKTNYEDVDLSNRIYDYGLKLMYNPEATVIHARKDTIMSVLATYWNWRQCRNMKSKYRGNIVRKIAYKLGYMVDNVDFFGTLFHEDMQERNYDLLPLDFIFKWYCFWQESKSFMRELLSRGR